MYVGGAVVLCQVAVGNGLELDGCEGLLVTVLLWP